MSAWSVVLAVGALTYALRVSMFVLLGSRSLPTWTERPLALVGPAAVAALVASMTLTSDDGFEPMGIAELCAVGAGFVAVRRTGDVVRAFWVGLPVVWALAAIGL